MATAPFDDLHEALDDEPRVVIEMGGTNIVIRASARVDRRYTSSLADVVNVASDTDTSVVIDPEPIRCDDDFAAYRVAEDDEPCAMHAGCRPVGVEVAAIGVVRMHAEHTVWLVDVVEGRFCQVDPGVDVRFLGRDGWAPVVAVCVTPSRLVALGVDGTLTSAPRAHRAPTAA